MPVEYKVTKFEVTWDKPTPSTDEPPASKKLWCRGVRIDAKINVTKYQAQVGRKYEVGLVQILDYSNQKALYKRAGPPVNLAAPIGARRFKIFSWNQRHLPVFDGDPTDKLFYDANSCKTITGTGPYSVQLLDYPTLVALKTTTSTNNITYNLIRALKYNKFHVLFIVRRSDAATKVGIWCDYLRDLEWATKVEASFDPGNHFTQLGPGYQSKSESFEPLTKVTALSPIRRWDMHKVNTANQDQTIKSEKDVLGILEFQDFTIDRYLPTVTV